MKVVLLCSWGGHMQQMFELRDAWGKYDYQIVTYDSPRIADMNEPLVKIHPSWTSVPRFLKDLTSLLVHTIFDKPKVLISTGMGWVDVFMFPLCKFLGTYTIYIESAANTTDVSGTGNICRRFSDRFLVKWEDLAERIGAEYHGGVF